MRRWLTDLRHPSPSRAADICLLELQARLARLGEEAGGRTAGVGHPAAERLFTVVARHYLEPTSVAALAGSAVA